ncbi:unnamed protein product, partial [Effrenium voratum]
MLAPSVSWAHGAGCLRQPNLRPAAILRGEDRKAAAPSRLCLGLGALLGASTARRCQERWDPTAPVWTEEDLQDVAVPATPGSHSHTLVYLHAFGRCGREYVQPLLDELSPGFSIPWPSDTLRVVLPTAPKGRQPWGVEETTWHQLGAEG